METRTARADALLLLTATIWGFAFVAQRVGMAYVGPFTFNGVRFALGSLSLVPLLYVLDRRPYCWAADWPVSSCLRAPPCSKSAWSIRPPAMPASLPGSMS